MQLKRLSTAKLKTQPGEHSPGHNCQWELTDAMGFQPKNSKVGLSGGENQKENINPTLCWQLLRMSTINLNAMISQFYIFCVFLNVFIGEWSRRKLKQNVFSIETFIFPYTLLEDSIFDLLLKITISFVAPLTEKSLNDLCLIFKRAVTTLYIFCWLLSISIMCFCLLS